MKSTSIVLICLLSLARRSRALRNVICETLSMDRY